MLLYELFQDMKKQTNKPRNNRKDNNYDINIETDLNNLKLELNYMGEIYNNLNLNIDNFLNSEIILNCFVIGKYHFKRCYNTYKKVDFIITNKKITLISKEYVETIKQIINYYDKIIIKLKKQANKDQITHILNTEKHYNN